MPAGQNLENQRPLVNQLNAILKELRLPITLESPAELTPSLLIKILEALLSERLPMNPPSRGRELDNLQMTKIFLGTLESDVLEMDVGLSNMDPRRLANGEWEEVVSIAELLCWVGRRHGLIVADDDFEAYGTPIVRRPEDYSPSTSVVSTTTKKTYTTTSMHRRTESNTSVGSSRIFDTVQKPSPPLPIRPRCIHEVPTPSEILSPALDSSFPVYDSDPPAEHDAAPRVRYTGYISPVDEELELLSFESCRNISMSGQTSVDQNVRP